MMDYEKQQEHVALMIELQNEYDENILYHKAQRCVHEGIRSSQISALVSLLIEKGILKPGEI